MADQTYVQIQPYLSRTHVDDVAHARLRVKIAVDFAQRRAESKRQLILRLCIESQHIIPRTQVSEVIVAVLIAERRRRLNHVPLGVHTQQRNLYALQQRLAVILQAVRVAVQPDRVADFAGFNRSDIERKPLFSGSQRKTLGRRRIAFCRRNARAARLAARQKARRPAA